CNQDADDERDDVEPTYRDLREDLVDDLEDRVKNERSDPADVADRVKARNHDPRAESDSSHRGRDARAAVEGEHCNADEARRRADDQQQSHDPHEKLERQGIPLCHYLPSSIFDRWLIRLLLSGGRSGATYRLIARI